MKINGPYASLLTIDHLISHVSWPSRSTSIYACCEAFAVPANYERGNLARHRLLRLNGLLVVVLLEPDELRPINPACTAIGGNVCISLCGFLQPLHLGKRHFFLAC